MKAIDSYQFQVQMNLRYGSDVATKGFTLISENIERLRAEKDIEKAIG